MALRIDVQTVLLDNAHGKRSTMERQQITYCPCNSNCHGCVKAGDGCVDFIETHGIYSHFLQPRTVRTTVSSSRRVLPHAGAEPFPTASPKLIANLFQVLAQESLVEAQIQVCVAFAHLASCRSGQRAARRSLNTAHDSRDPTIPAQQLFHLCGILDHK